MVGPDSTLGSGSNLDAGWGTTPPERSGPQLWNTPGKPALLLDKQVKRGGQECSLPASAGTPAAPLLRSEGPGHCYTRSGDIQGSIIVMHSTPQEQGPSYVKKTCLALFILIPSRKSKQGFRWHFIKHDFSLSIFVL